MCINDAGRYKCKPCVDPKVPNADKSKCVSPQPPTTLPGEGGEFVSSFDWEAGGWRASLHCCGWCCCCFIR